MAVATSIAGELHSVITDVFGSRDGEVIDSG